MNGSILVKLCFNTRLDYIVVSFTYLQPVLHKVVSFVYLLESPWRGDSNTYPKHMILYRNFENYNFLSF